MKKRIFSILLTVVMLLGMIPGTAFTAFAAETPTPSPAPTADIVIENLLLPEAGQTIDEYHTDAYESWMDGSFTVNGGVWDAESWTFGDVLYDGIDFLDGSMNSIDYDTWTYTEFAPGTYYMVLYLGEEFDEDTTAIVNGAPAEVKDLGDGWVEVLVKLTVEAAPTITITGLTAPIAGQTMAEYDTVFGEMLLDGSFTVNGAVFDDEDYNFGDVLYDGWNFYNSDGTLVGESAEIVPGTYYIGFYFGEDFGAGTTATANGTAGCVYYEEDWNGWVDVSFELNVTEEGTTIVPYVAPGNSIDAVEITLPAIAAGGNVPTASNVTLSDSNCTVTSVETLDPGYDVLYDRFEDGKVYYIELMMKAKPGYALDGDTVITLADANTENLRVEIKDYQLYSLGNASFAYVELVARVGNPTPYWIGFRNNVGVVESYFGYGNGEYTLPECTFTVPSGKVFKAWQIAGNEYAAGATFNLTEDVWALAVWMNALPAAALGDVDFGTKIVGYDSVADNPVITNTGNQILEFGPAYMKAELTGAGASAFTYGFNTSTGAISVGNSSSNNLWVRLKADQPVGEYTATMTLYYDRDADGTTYDWEVLDTCTITATVDPKPTYFVTFNGTNCESNGAGTATTAENYTATISKSANRYKLPTSIVVQAGENTLVAGVDYTYNADNGKVTINASAITGNITITAVAVLNTYTVTFQGENYTTEGANTPIHGEDYVVTLKPDDGYEIDNGDLVIMIGGNVLMSYNGEWTFDDATDTLTIVGAEVDDNLTISVSPDKIPGKFNVTWTNDTGYQITAADGYSSLFTEGNDIRFTITITYGYRATSAFKVKANGVEVAKDGDVYVIPSVTESQTISVQGVE